MNIVKYNSNHYFLKRKEKEKEKKYMHDPPLPHSGSLCALQISFFFLDVTVVGNSRRGSLHIAEDLGTGLIGEILHQAVELGDALDVLEGHEVGGETSDVRRCHAGTAEDLGVSVGLDTNREDLDTRGKDVDVLAKVGEAGLGVVGGVNGPDGDGVGGRCW